MEAAAQKQYQAKLTELDARLQQVQTKLGELQGKKGEGNRLVATPEMAKAIEDFQKQQAAMRGERREIRRALREDIDRLESRLLIANLLATPLSSRLRPVVPPQPENVTTAGCWTDALPRLRQMNRPSRTSPPFHDENQDPHRFVLILAASGTAYLAWRPAPLPSGDARINQPMVDRATSRRPPGAPQRAGKSVELTRTDGTWRVPSYYDMPADFSKLSGSSALAAGQRCLPTPAHARLGSRHQDRAA